MDGHGRSRGPHDDDTGDVIALLAWFWRHRRIVAGAMLAGGVLAFLLSFLMPTIYTARATLLPEQDNADAALLSQVALFTGLSLGKEASFEQLYFKIVTSDRLLDEAIAHDWSTDDDAETYALYDALSVDRGDGEDRHARHDLRKKLREDVLTLVRDAQTGFITLSASVPGDPVLAAALANFMVERLDAFNLEHRSAKAVEQRTFVEERLDISRAALDAANGVLTDFVSANRSYRSSPELLQRYTDLERETQAELTVWTELRRQLELAKIDEHKQLGTITVLDRASAPDRRSSPRRGLVAAVGILVGAVLALAFLLLRETAAGIRTRR
ncbi:hypothetical protein H8E07_12515 [bacterium]|nr:hypothetical protein [bacterium]